MKIIVILIVGSSVLFYFAFPACLEGRDDVSTKVSVKRLVDQSTETSQPPVERLIHALSGEWSTEEIYDPSDLLPTGGTGHSRDTYRAGPARMSVVQEYHGNGAAGKSWGTGIIWWEPQDHGFHFVWCDTYTLDRGCRVSSQVGNWEGDDFILTNVREVSGKKVVEREVWSSFSPDSFIQTLYVGAAPDKLKRFMTIKAHRLVKHRE
jgi:hypothetical protein